MKKISLSILAIASVTLTFGQVVGNNSFEDPALAANQYARSSALPPNAWTFNGVVNNDSGIANGNSSWGVGGHSGAQYAFIQMTSSIQQNISLNVGQLYEVDYWMMRRSGSVGGNVANPITVSMGGVGLRTDTPPNDAVWHFYSASFVATSTTETLKFSGPSSVTQDQTSLIDDVSFQAVPEPSSMLALGGLAVIALRKRRRR